MFLPDLQRFVAIGKRKGPPYVINKTNGPGGKLDKGETPIGAMVREWKEETGMQTAARDWRPFLVLNGEEDTIHFFVAISENAMDARTQPVPEGEEEEPITIINWRGMLAYGEPAHNLHWIIPMALDPETRIHHVHLRNK
jgi:8-oxo-dGTP diphosphatase